MGKGYICLVTQFKAMKEVRTFRIERKSWEAFKRLARRMNKKPTSLIRELIIDFLNRNRRAET